MKILECDNLKKIKKLQYKVLSKEKFGGAKKTPNSWTVYGNSEIINLISEE